MRAPNRAFEVVQHLRLEFCVWWNLGSECVWHALLEPLAGSEHCSPPCQVLITKIKINCLLSTHRCCSKVWLVLGASINGIKYYSWWTVILKSKSIQPCLVLFIFTSIYGRSARTSPELTLVQRKMIFFFMSNFRLTIMEKQQKGTHRVYLTTQEIMKCKRKNM